MADQTIHDESVVTTAAVGDEILIWRAANSDTKRITKANFIGATFTGSGTIATGGFTLTVAGNSTINGSLVGNIAGGFTLTMGGNSSINGSLVGSLTVTGGGTLALGGFTATVPATGTVGIIDAVQTLTNKTLSAPVVTGRMRLNSGAALQDAMSEAIAIGNVTSTQTVTIDITLASGNIAYVTDFALSLLRSASAGVYGLAYGKVSWSGTGGGSVTIRDSTTSFKSSGTVTGSVTAITGGIRISITSTAFGNTMNANTFSHTTTGIGASNLTVTVTIT